MCLIRFAVGRDKLEMKARASFGPLNAKLFSP